MYKNKNTSSSKQRSGASSRKKTAAIVAVIVVLAATGLLVYKHLQSKSSVETAKTSTDQKQVINDTPATPEEQKDSEDSKDKIVDQQKAGDSGSPASGSLTPVITRADTDPDNSNQIIIASYVSGVVEDGGTCTMAATNGQAKVTRTTESVANVSNTVCPSFEINKSSFTPAGTWSVTISYASAKGSGTSTPKQINLP